MYHCANLISDNSLEIASRRYLSWTIKPVHFLKEDVRNIKLSHVKDDVCKLALTLLESIIIYLLSYETQRINSAQ